jgi:hypothetical protein
LRYLRELRGKPVEQLLEARYQKFRRMGVFDEGLAEAGANGATVRLGIEPFASAHWHFSVC